ncbi:MAG: hypothetical protein HF314_14490 [Ignavibacteria bacterium]|jgi:hypothetical protein|nr:hypothetical protein [Ignavibacteria bacterium]MCU7504288.1 hypothetical protein [Ignavibacteria bacterium]MCU7516133.1 hypothetical protein [Ignavibacteria bacterium]
MKAAEVFKKLRLDKAENLLIVNAPDGYTQILEDINYDSKPATPKVGRYGFVQVFATSQTEMEKLLKEVEKAGVNDCIFWACYPKGTGKIKSDIKRETLWNALGLIGLRPVSQIAIDETWSALRGRPADKVGK